MRSKGRPRRRNYGLELVMHGEVRRTPREQRPALLRWLRRWVRRRERVFWELDAGTGEWRRV